MGKPASKTAALRSKIDKPWKVTTSSSNKPTLKLPVRTVTHWRLDGSIWYPRKTTGNSGDYHETPECMRLLFERDWHLAEQAHGLDRAIMRHNEVSIDSTREVLWAHHQMIYGL